MKNVRKHRNIRLVLTLERKNYLVSEPSYRTKKIFSDYLLAIEIKKTHILMSKPVYSGLKILEISKIVTCEFCYDYVKVKYDKKANYATWIQILYSIHNNR